MRAAQCRSFPLFCMRLSGSGGPTCAGTSGEFWEEFEGFLLRCLRSDCPAQVLLALTVLEPASCGPLAALQIQGWGRSHPPQGGQAIGCRMGPTTNRQCSSTAASSPSQPDNAQLQPWLHSTWSCAHGAALPGRHLCLSRATKVTLSLLHTGLWDTSQQLLILFVSPLFEQLDRNSPSRVLKGLNKAGPEATCSKRHLCLRAAAKPCNSHTTKGKRRSDYSAHRHWAARTLGWYLPP